MPFQSEKQRRYLWANEPEIARDWTDTYGSGIAKAVGGRIPFAEGSKKTSIPEWNLAILKTALETATSDEERAEIQSQIDTVEGDIGTGADTLLGSGEAPTEGFWGKLSKMLGMSQAEGAEIGNTAEDVMRQEFFDYGTQEADMGEYANLKVPGLNVQHPEGIASINPHGWEYGNQWQKPPAKQNWLANLKKYAMPTYNFMRGNVGAGLLGVMNPLAGLAMFAGGKNLKDSRFYRGATTGTGGYTPEQLNSMNALGGWYSEPARQQSRADARRTNILNRAAEGKAVGNVGSLGPNYRSDNQGGLTYTGPAPTKSQVEAGATTRSDKGWQNDPFSKGGLATLWPR